MAEKKKNPHSPQSASGSSEPRPTVCTVDGCKSMGARFGFCKEHYEHYKFGLIRKDGKKAVDYEKKLEHYQRFKERKLAQQVA